MNLTAIEDAIRAWVLQASALPAGAVIFAHQGGVSPVPGPAATISIGDMLSVGTDELTSTFDDAAANGQEVVFEARGPRVFSCEVTFFSPDVTGDAGARAAAAATQAALRLPTVRYALNQAGLGVLREGPVRWVPRLDGSWLGQAMLEVQFVVMQSATERTGYIETVVADFSAGPLMVIQGGVDVARLLKLERWARADQPSFPRIIANSRNGSAVQFSRFGADVVTNTVRNPGHLRDLAGDAALIGSSLARAHTLSWWMRPDPLSSQPVGTSTSQRVFGLTGFGTTPTAQGCFYGVTYSPATSALLLVTQVPGNVGGTSISALSSTFVYSALPVGVWSHVAVVLAPNGLDAPPLNIGATATWYLNGALAFTQIGDGSIGGSGPRMPQWSLFPPPRAIASVGATWSNSAGVFANGYDGAADEICLYPRALSAAEVATLYASGPFGLRV